MLLKNLRLWQTIKKKLAKETFLSYVEIAEIVRLKKWLSETDFNTYFPIGNRDCVIEEGQYDYSRQKYLDVIIRSLRETLKEAGVEEILEIKGGFLRVKTEMLDCDLYRFLRNDPEAVNAYRGEYMEEYPWAVFNAASLSSRE